MSSAHDLAPFDPPQGGRLLVGAHTTLVCAPGPSTQRRQQRPPVWKLVIPFQGAVEWRTAGGATGRAPAVVYPPDVSHAARTSTGHMAVHLDAWPLALGGGGRHGIVLPEEFAARLRGTWSDVTVGELDAAAADTVAYLRCHDVLADPVPADPRVVAAMDRLLSVASVARLAAQMGLSPSRLRSLVHISTGSTLVRLRAWLRLRRSIESLSDSTIAVAAAKGGFADQPHLTRTATQLIGHTPADLTQLLLR